TKNYYALPYVKGYLKFDNVLTDLHLKISSSYLQMKSEPSLLQSYGFLTYTQFSAESSRQNFPTEELENFGLPTPEDLKKWEHSLQFNYFNSYISLVWNNQKKTDAIFPVWENGDINFRNIGNYRQK